MKRLASQEELCCLNLIKWMNILQVFEFLQGLY